MDHATLKTQPEFQNFWSEVQGAMRSCPRLELNEAQMENLRLEVSGEVGVCAPLPSPHPPLPPSPSPPPAPPLLPSPPQGPPGAEPPLGIILGAVFGGVGLAVIGALVAIRFAYRAAAKPNTLPGSGVTTTSGVTMVSSGSHSSASSVPMGLPTDPHPHVVKAVAVGRPVEYA